MPTCRNKDLAYWALIISIIPLWIILTSLIVFVLLALHKNFRATKIYDNCNRQTAYYVYHIELRTGDTSQSFNKRRTTLNIDMFDDAQNTLARIAIPGHVIFGRRGSPINVLDDDKFTDLRVTRLWLYRASRLKKVATIRLTHTGAEPDARIMIYGIELRSDDSDRPRLFFPIMNYINAYGCATRPNACFDIEPNGTISAMGGSSSDTSPITEQLTLVDYSFLVYLFCSLLFLGSIQKIFPNSLKQMEPALYSGAVIGPICYFLTVLFGIILRYVVKQKFSLAIGLGLWAGLYYSTLFFILIVSTVLWIYTTVEAYQDICPDQYQYWLITIGLAALEGFVLFIVGAIISWTIQIINPKHTEQYIVHDDLSEQNKISQNPDASTGGLQKKRSKDFSRLQQIQHKKQQQQQQQQQDQISHLLAPDTHPSIWTTTPAPSQNASMQYFGYPNQQATYSPNNLPPSPAPYQATSPRVPYTIQTASPPAGPVFGSQKTFQTAYTGTYEPNYQHQVNAKPMKKVGSNESTGSSYYHQLMKNKGGVKSISQYGELLRQKKGNKDKK